MDKETLTKLIGPFDKTKPVAWCVVHANGSVMGFWANKQAAVEYCDPHEETLVPMYAAIQDDCESRLSNNSCENRLKAAMDAAYHEAEKVVELKRELAASQAREKVLRDAVWVCMEHDKLHHGTNHNTVRLAELALSQPTDDSALQDLILKERVDAISKYKSLGELMNDDASLNMMLEKEFTKGYERGIAGYHEGLKIALAAERERCAKVAWNMEPDENGPIETAIRALGKTNE